MGKVITADFRRPTPPSTAARRLAQEQEILNRLKEMVARLKARAAGPDCPPGVGWRRGE
jgi:hypothetical protein